MQGFGRTVDGWPSTSDARGKRPDICRVRQRPPVQAISAKVPSWHGIGIVDVGKACPHKLSRNLVSGVFFLCFFLFFKWQIAVNICLFHSSAWRNRCHTKERTRPRRRIRLSSIPTQRMPCKSARKANAEMDERRSGCRSALGTSAP